MGWVELVKAGLCDQGHRVIDETSLVPRRGGSGNETKMKLTAASPQTPQTEVRPTSHQQQWKAVAASSKSHPEIPPSDKIQHNKTLPERHCLTRALCNRETLSNQSSVQPTLLSHSCRLFSALTHTGELLFPLGVGIFSPEIR